MLCCIIFSFSLVLCCFLHFHHSQASPAQTHVSLTCTAPVQPFPGTKQQWLFSHRDVSTQQGWIIVPMPPCRTHIHQCPKMAVSAPPQSWGPVPSQQDPVPPSFCLGLPPQVTPVEPCPHRESPPYGITPIGLNPEMASTL